MKLNERRWYIRKRGGKDSVLFLIRYESKQPPMMSDEEWRAILAEERKHGTKAFQEGKLKELYLVAGTKVGFLTVEFGSAEELHQWVSGLPLYRYTDWEVYPLVDIGAVRRQG